MEPIIEKIIVTVFSAAAQAALMPVGRRIVASIWGKAKNAKPSEIQRLLEQLANASGPAIRSLVEKAAKERTVPKEEAEELIQLLINLSKNARFHTTNGTKLSTVIQTEKLIEQLLTDFEPKRRRGEPVSPNSDWILEQFLGMGGFGEVWRAKNSLFHGARAFKFFTDPANQEWLKKEGHALARVKEELGNHPNIVQYIDIATQATPYPYLALDFANGGSLEDWIDQPPHEQVDLNIEELMSNIIDGLCEAHASNIFHRDIKPANILLNYKADDDPPTPLIADFGLSRADPAANVAAARTSAVSSREIVVGTQMYLPPEAMSYGGMDSAQQDIFALGVTWYQLLVSKVVRPPYDFADHLRQLGIETRTVRLLSRCLAQPSRRFRDAIELKRTFEDVNGTGDWPVPEGCFDVGLLTRAAFARMAKA